MPMQRYETDLLQYQQQQKKNTSSEQGIISTADSNKNNAVSPSIVKDSSDISSPVKKSPTFISLHLPVKKVEIACEEDKQNADGDLFENES